MIKKRIWVAMGAIVFMMGLLVARLVFVQLIDGEEYKNISSVQHTIALEGANQRGEIYDTNMVPLTGTLNDYVYIIEKNKVDKTVWKIFDLLGGRKVAGKNSKYAVFSSSVFSEEASFILERDYDAFALESRRRYDREQPAVHLIGYINEVDGKGAAGIEKDFNESLSMMTQKLYGKMDATGKIIQGEGVFKEKTEEKFGVVTTLDLTMQKKAEEILKSSGYNGALVVTDVQKGEILASASYPVYNPYDVKKYLESPNMEFINKVTQGQYPPGSIFKIVVAAAALEEGLVQLDTKFVCKGYQVINGIRINCSREEGHGEIDFRQAFAKSCNVAFIQLGQQIGAERIINMADRFGYGKKVLEGISDEKVGILSKLKDVQGAGIGNLSIGQGKLTVTPIQASRATMIIANGGIDKGLQLVKSVIKKGQVEEIKKPAEVRVISQETADKINELMRGTVEYGTASYLIVKDQLGQKVKIGGKTGSAESTSKGEAVVHGWFTGFFPADNPQYAITVFAENGGVGKSVSISMFQQMAQSLKFQ